MIRYTTHIHIYIYMYINEYMCYCHKPLSSHNTVARAFLLCLCINRCTCFHWSGITDLGRVFMLTVKEPTLFKLKCTIRLRSRSVQEHIELYQIDIRLLWVRIEVIYINFHIQFIRGTFHYWESELIFGNLTNKYIVFIQVLYIAQVLPVIFRLKLIYSQIAFLY